MKILQTTKFLGLAVTDRSILAAEVRKHGEARTVTRVAEFAIPADKSWDQPAALGESLRQFLRLNRFSASRTVLGVPARWLMARAREVPPASNAAAANTLRLLAEREFAVDRDLVFDYAGQSDPQRKTRVLLAAMLQDHLDRVSKVADTAGLSLAAVTASTLTLAAAAGGQGVLVVSADAAELALGGESAPRMLRYLAVAETNGAERTEAVAKRLAALGGEVRQAVALSAPVGGETASRELLLWDGLDLGPEAASTLGQRTGLEVRDGDMRTVLGAAPPNGQKNASRFACAVALAVAGSRQSLPLDFLHSRLAPPVKRRVSRRTALIALGAVALVGGITWLYVDVNRREASLEDLRSRIRAMAPDVKTAKTVTEKVSYARGWYPRPATLKPGTKGWSEMRPPVLSCMENLAQAFPDEGQIWVTSFSLRENHKGLVSGKAVDQRAVLSVLDKLKTRPGFSDVTLQDMRDEGGRSRLIIFSIGFNFVGME